MDKLIDQLTIDQIEEQLNSGSIPVYDLFLHVKNFGSSHGNRAIASQGNRAVLKLLLEKYIKIGENYPEKETYHLYRLLNAVCARGDVELLRGLFKLGIYLGDNSFWTACECGQIEIVKILIAEGAYKGAYGLWDGLCGASHSHHVDVARYLMENGADTQKDKNICLYGGALTKDMDMVNLAIEKGANNFEEGLKFACQNGDIEMIKLMRKCGAKNVNNGLLSAISSDKIELAEFLIGEGANNFDEALVLACQKGHLGLIEQLIKLGAENIDIDSAMIAGCLHGRLAVIELLVSLGGSNFGGCFAVLCKFPSEKHIAIMIYLIGQGYQPKEIITEMTMETVMKLKEFGVDLVEEKKLSLASQVNWMDYL